MRSSIANAIRTSYEYVAMYFGLVFLGVLCLAWTPVAMVLRVLLPRAPGRSVGRWVISLAFRAYLNVLRAIGAYRLDLTALDVLRLMSAMPRRTALSSTTSTKGSTFSVIQQKTRR